MRRLIKKFLIIITIILLTMIMLIGEAKASLQSNINTHDKRNDEIKNWIVNIRKMEENGEAMGLNETLNEDLTSAGESNNIDVHMLKSTEYGAVAILSASGYGNPQTLQESTIKTTTGNKTGVYFSGNTAWEYVAATRISPITVGVDPRYYDEYAVEGNIEKVGDALGTATAKNPGCSGWHSASSALWPSQPGYYFVRGYGGLFSFGIYGVAAMGRGVAVSGVGL